MFLESGCLKVRGDRVALERLIEIVQACRRCATMEGRRRVLSHANGQPGARVLFVAEAPGRFGGERTGIPLSADQTGRNFRRLLDAAGLDGDEVFITNAVLCNPRRDGKNRAPAAWEVANCREHLVRTIDAVDPPLVAALGVVALRSLAAIAPHEATLRTVGKPVAWYGRSLVPLYHPGPRAQIHRSFAQQQEDFRLLGALVRELTHRRPRSLQPAECAPC
ncbi:MAG: DNA polymerase [Dehalococcoidia bacterium]|nr:MAG: DNA polymerase [Dehalococcoidia bacterium]